MQLGRSEIRRHRGDVSRSSFNEPRFTEITSANEPIIPLVFPLARSPRNGESCRRASAPEDSRTGSPIYSAIYSTNCHDQSEMIYVTIRRARNLVNLCSAPREQCPRGTIVFSRGPGAVLRIKFIRRTISGAVFALGSERMGFLQYRNSLSLI